MFVVKNLKFSAIKNMFFVIGLGVTCYLGFLFTFWFLMIFCLNRLTLAMASIVITSLQTRLINQRCGLKPGLGGKLFKLVTYDKNQFLCHYY